MAAEQRGELQHKLQAAGRLDCGKLLVAPSHHLRCAGLVLASEGKQDKNCQVKSLNKAFAWEGLNEGCDCGVYLGASTGEHSESVRLVWAFDSGCAFMWPVFLSMFLFCVRIL